MDIYKWAIVENIVTIAAIVLTSWLMESPWALVLMLNLNTLKTKKQG